MKYSIAALLIVLIFCMCNTSQPGSKEIRYSDNKENVILEKRSINDIRQDKILNSDVVLKELNIQGTFIDGAKYIDSLGENYILIYLEGRKDLKDTIDYGDVLIAEKYIRINGHLKRSWKINDFNENYGCNISYLGNSLITTDLNNDGIFESSFLYYFPCDGSDPVKVKYMVHIEDKKYVLKGSVPILLNEFNSGDVLLDKNLETLNPIFNEFYLKKWDSLVFLIYKSY